MPHGTQVPISEHVMPFRECVTPTAVKSDTTADRGCHARGSRLYGLSWNLQIQKDLGSNFVSTRDFLLALAE